MDALNTFLAAEFLGKANWIWLSFVGAVVALLAFDLGVVNRKDHEIGVGESLRLSAFYIAIGIGFAFVIWQLYNNADPATSIDPQLLAVTGAERAWMAVQLYLTGFAVEKTLALDNVFVISMVFAYLAIPRMYQHRVLFWGIIGVIVLRAIMIGLGAALVSQFSWVLYVFAVFLILTGVMMFRKGAEHEDVSKNKILLWLKKRLNVTPELHGNKFRVQLPDPNTGKLRWVATPLLLALLFVEIVDLVFAIDSVPAIFAITSDPYIVYTSNIFAILGLRALFFALAAMVHRFQYLKYALALTLVFIGSKIFLGDLFEGGKFPATWSLAITVTKACRQRRVGLARAHHQRRTIMIVRMLLASAGVFALAACGDLSSDLENAKQEAVAIGRETLEAAGGEVNTRNACLLAGQSEAFCSCLSERLGAEITPEQIGAVSEAVQATLAGETIASTEGDPASIDASTRQAVVQCATRAAIDGAVGEGAN
jgi:tellurite resistance protein TerC